MDSKRLGVDIYEMVDDPLKGFTVNPVGNVASERVVGFNWSGTGDIFNIFELEGSKSSLSFFMIVKDMGPAI